MNLRELDLDTPPTRLGVSEMEAAVAILDNPTFAWILHQVCGAEKRSAAGLLEDSDETEPGRLGKLRGKIRAMKAFPINAEQLKQKLIRQIERVREEAGRNA
jgi:hypothetical protein